MEELEDVEVEDCWKLVLAVLLPLSGWFEGDGRAPSRWESMAQLTSGTFGAFAPRMCADNSIDRGTESLQCTQTRPTPS